jgi:hypothetical protein
MHLGAKEVMTRKILQGCWAQHSASAMNSFFLAGYAVAVQATFAGPIPVALQQMIDYLFARASFYAQLVTRWNLIDEYLFDIPLTEYLYRREFRPRLHLRIGDLPDDRTAMKMTGFTIAHLRSLYEHFGLRDFVHAHHETELLIGTNTFHPSNGSENCYRFDPEELLLYSLTRIKTGMTQEMIIDHYFGGDYTRWSYGHRWMMLYLDMRYGSIIGHEGILRFLPLFGEFRNAIEKYCQKDRLYYDHEGNGTLVPGLNELPFNICAFIDGTIDPILVPFSGPAGDYEGAPRRPQFILAQESVYSGYKKMHGHKMETVFFPNGISTCFGPVSARQNDRGTLNMSGLDRFLVLIQAHLPPHMKCMVFGDSVYHGNLEMITSYYRAIPPDVLTPSELRCNAALRAARMPIERNYGLQSCVQRICDTRRGSSYGSERPYAIEQLRVCHLLINCYICLNGDQASGANTFAYPPPSIDEYLRI